MTSYIALFSMDTIATSNAESELVGKRCRDIALFSMDTIATDKGHSYFYLSRMNFAIISSRERYVFLFFFVFLFAIFVQSSANVSSPLFSCCSSSRMISLFA